MNLCHRVAAVEDPPRAAYFTRVSAAGSCSISASRARALVCNDASSVSQILARTGFPEFRS